MHRLVTLAALGALVVTTVSCTSTGPRKRGSSSASKRDETPDKRGATKRGASNRRAGAIKLAVLPAESDRFPRAARAATEQLRKASVSGVDRKEVSKVSLEVVQLSIECVQPTSSCYAAVGKSLAANRLLFAQLSGRSKRLKVKVTLFDVDAKSPRIAQKTFRSEAEASAGVADLVAEATR